MNYATEWLLAAANASLTAWEGEEQSVREEHRETIEELESALHYFNAHGDRPTPIRVLVALEGGLVQGAVADRAGVAVTVLDYDTEGADADGVYAIPQQSTFGDLGTAEACRSHHAATNDPAFIDAAEAAPIADPAAAAEELRASIKRAEGWTWRSEEERARYIAEQLAEVERLEALASEEEDEEAGA